MLGGIAYFQFHPRHGNQLVYVSKKEDGNPIELPAGLVDYVLPKAELNGRLIVFHFETSAVLGYPVGIINQKYERNIFQYNLCVLAPSSDVKLYVNAIVKLANYLESLENELSLLSDESQHGALFQLFDEIYESLKKTGACAIPVTDATTVNIRLTPQPAARTTVQRFMVPILCFDPDNLNASSMFDVATLQVLPFINGISSVNRIAILASVDISVVEGVVGDLCAYGMAKLLPPFTYYARYAATPALSKLWSQRSVLVSACRFVKIPKDPNDPHMNDVYRLLCAFDGALPVSDFVLRCKPHELHIDEKRLIQFGVFHGYLRRLFAYPYLQSGLDEGVDDLPLPLAMFTGNACVEELFLEACNEHDYSQSINAFLECLECHPALTILWK